MTSNSAKTPIFLLDPKQFEHCQRTFSLAIEETDAGWASLCAEFSTKNGAQLRFHEIEGRFPEYEVAGLAFGFAQIELNGARLLASEQTLPIDPRHWQTLIATVTSLLEESELHLIEHRDQRLSIQLHADPKHALAKPPTCPWLDQAVGSRLNLLLPQPLAWAKLQNELQMAIAQLELHSERATHRMPTINCVWIWGHSTNGRDPPRLESTSGDPMIKALLAANQATSNGSSPNQGSSNQGASSLATALIDVRNAALPAWRSEQRLMCLDGRRAQLKLSWLQRLKLKFGSQR